MKLFTLLISFFITFTAFAQIKGTLLKTDAARDLIPEGIAIWDSTLFISSINKHLIVAIDPHGKSKNFIQPDQDGFAEGLGMQVDNKRGWLWALSNRKKDKTFTSQIQAFGLADGKTKLRNQITDTIPHLFNDLAIDASGTLYITDTYYSAVYCYKPDSEKLELFLKSPYLNYPNGIALGSNHTLYIATYENGLMQLNTNTKELQPLQGYEDSAMAHGLDGLVYWNHTLIGVYNGSEDRRTNALVQYHLDASDSKIVSEKLIDKGNPAFYEPTTAACTENTLYLLANSHLALYNKNKTTTKGIEENLLSPMIIIYKLLP